MIDYELVGTRLAVARRQRATAAATIAEAKRAKNDAEQEIEECLQELETGEPSRPLLDEIEKNGKAKAAAAEAPRDTGPTDYFGKRQRKTKAPKNAPPPEQPAA